MLLPCGLPSSSLALTWDPGTYSWCLPLSQLWWSSPAKVLWTLPLHSVMYFKVFRVSVFPAWVRVVATYFVTLPWLMLLFRLSSMILAGVVFMEHKPTHGISCFKSLWFFLAFNREFRPPTVLWEARSELSFVCYSISHPSRIKVQSHRVALTMFDSPLCLIPSPTSSTHSAVPPARGQPSRTWSPGAVMISLRRGLRADALLWFPRPSPEPAQTLYSFLEWENYEPYFWKVFSLAQLKILNVTIKKLFFTVFRTPWAIYVLTPIHACSVVVFKKVFFSSPQNEWSYLT